MEYSESSSQNQCGTPCCPSWASISEVTVLKVIPAKVAMNINLSGVRVGVFRTAWNQELKMGKRQIGVQ